MEWKNDLRIRYVRAHVLVAAASLALAGPAQAADVIPTQWIAKQYTEVLGRAPLPAEWEERVAFYRMASACDAASLRALGLELARSSAFAQAYPETTALDRTLRLSAVVRAAFNHDPNMNDWNAFFVPYVSGSASWEQTIQAVYGGVFAFFVAPAACQAGEAGYGFAYSPPLDLRQVVGLSPSRSQAQLQAAINAAAPGSVVALQPGEVVRIGGTANGNQGLEVKAGVTLTTAGGPRPRQYARMGRLVPAGPGAAVCVSFLCDNVGIVNLAAGASLRNVWVDGQGTAAANYKLANIETRGSSTAAPTVVVDNRITNPGRDGAGIRARGFAISGQDCAGERIRRNVVTAYASRHRFDGLGQAEWADGIAVECEQAVVEANDVVDASDAGIVLYGSFNHAARAGRAQRSRAAGNRVLSAGLSGLVALGADAIGSCLAPRNWTVPCLDISQERSFQGAVVQGNTFWTGPRTHFDVGLMVGGGPRWGNHRVFGSGAVFRDNTAGTGSVRANIGVSVLGMRGATLTGNLASYTLVDGNPRARFGKCPRVAVGVGSEELASLVPGAQASVVHDAADGCLLGEAPAEGPERIVIAADRHGFVGSVSARPFFFWATGAPLDIAGDWNEVVENFRELRRMGFNTLRVLLQSEDFLVEAPPGQRPTLNAQALARFADVLQLARETGVYLDITGLGIERTADTGTWFDQLSEEARWDAQAIFWQGIAGLARDNTSVGFYDLMNEPAIPTADTPLWCRGSFGGFCFTQNITRTPAGRTTATIARQWLTRMVAAIRQDAGDQTNLIALGTIFCGGPFHLSNTADFLDFQIVHRYPRFDDPATPVNELQQDIDYVRGCAVPDAPLVVEETAVLAGGELDLETFIRQTQASVGGFSGQYQGRTPAEIEPPATFPEAFHLATYRVFLYNGFRATRIGTGVLQP